MSEREALERPKTRHDLFTPPMTASPQALAATLGQHLRDAGESDPHLRLLLTESPPGSDGGMSSSDDELELMMEASQASKNARWLSLEPGQVKQHNPAPQGASAHPHQQLPSAQGTRPTRIVFSPSSESGANHVFQREALSAASDAEAPSSVSGLSALLQSRMKVPTMHVKVFGAPANARGEALALEVPTDAHFVTVIALILARTPGVEPSAPSAYQLLMADPDGDADDDLIPQRDKPLSELGWRDFALCKASPTLAAAQARSDPPVPASGGEPGGRAGSSLPHCGPGAMGAATSPGVTTDRGGRHGLMRVHLPREAFGQRLGQWVIKHPYRPDALLIDLMHEVCRLQRVRLHPMRHVFVLSQSEHSLGALVNDEPLDMSKRLHELDLPLSDTGEPEIRVSPKLYADEPAKQHTLGSAAERMPRRSVTHADVAGDGIKRSGGSTAGSGSGGSRGGRSVAGRGGCSESTSPQSSVAGTVDDVVFFPGEAILYKEYNVVKVNKYGARQERVLGIDNHKLHNLAVANAREDDKAPTSFRDSALKLFGVRKAETGTKHRGWLMQDLDRVWLVGGEKPCDFCVVFRDPHDARQRKEHRYEAETPQAAFEIVKKLLHISSQKADLSERFGDDVGETHGGGFSGGGRKGNR